MKSVEIYFENCYGIGNLEYTFNFNSKNVYAIYAPNGVMKTSFAKTFKDASLEKESKDLIFEDRKTIRKINNENNNQLASENIFVIEPYLETFKSEKTSTLLVNQKLKGEYEKIHFEIDEKKENLLELLKNRSGIKNGLENEISDFFTRLSNYFEAAIKSVESDINNSKEPEYDDIIYQKIFNEKSIKILQDEDFRKKLEKYIEIYEKLISKSMYFRKGVFNQYNASAIAKSLEDNGFFKASHSVALQDRKGEKTPIENIEDLEKAIEDEKNSILENSELIKTFGEIDKKLNANKELRDFREYLLENLKILPELINITLLKRKLWISYFKAEKFAYNALLNAYKSAEKEIEKILKQAQEEKTEWEKVLDIFNKRFSVPFKLSIGNQVQVMLGNDIPKVSFDFYDTIDTKKVEENNLLAVLSTGEKRALYLLNIIFEVEARKSEGIETLFIIDDIADSFDYKNKYAIIEYLKEISGSNIFRQIILTHNYDFFRTVSGRLDMARDNKLTAERIRNEVILYETKYQNNPFEHWKENLNDDAMLVALIPFVRNIAEYTGNKQIFSALTSCLHYKNDTANLKIEDLEKHFKSILSDIKDIPNKQRKVLDVIYNAADIINSNAKDKMDLESKIVLAIAIRMKAEEYLVQQINDANFCNNIKKNQFRSLHDKYKELFQNNYNEIKLFEKVNLMTPENIHLNSFMYEPILDMSNNNLIELYNDILQLA
jgi:ABC-type lipoprotein export system ATPase subunit